MVLFTDLPNNNGADAEPVNDVTSDAVSYDIVLPTVPTYWLIVNEPVVACAINVEPVIIVNANNCLETVIKGFRLSVVNPK